MTDLVVNIFIVNLSSLCIFCGCSNIKRNAFGVIMLIRLWLWLQGSYVKHDIHDKHYTYLGDIHTHFLYSLVCPLTPKYAHLCKYIYSQTNKPLSGHLLVFHSDTCLAFLYLPPLHTYFKMHLYHFFTPNTFTKNYVNYTSMVFVSCHCVICSVHSF